MSNILFSSIMGSEITGAAFLAMTACSLALGLVIAGAYMLKNQYTRSFAVALALLPAIVQMVIMLVNGNIGAGVAVAGAFSLVRFRSAPGSAQEITSIFLAMTVGLATGMGYLGIAVVFTLIIIAANLILTQLKFGERGSAERSLKITVPETLDYEGVFDDLFTKYTKRAELLEVRTTAMGSLYRLQYDVVMREKASVKEFMDEIRKRNGNLEISLGRIITVSEDRAL